MNFHQVRLLSKVKADLPSYDFWRQIHAFISSRLGYCNSLYVILDRSCSSHLDRKEKAWSHHTWTRLPTLAFSLVELYWHGVPFNCPSAHSLPLQSEHWGQQTNWFWKFPHPEAIEPCPPWNSLPLHLRAAQTNNHFKTLLKTNLFSLAFSPSWARHLSLQQQL